MQKLCFSSKLVALFGLSASSNWTTANGRRSACPGVLSRNLVSVPLVRSQRKDIQTSSGKWSRQKKFILRLFSLLGTLLEGRSCLQKGIMEFIIPFFSGLNKFLDRIIVNYLESGQFLGFFLRWGVQGSTCSGNCKRFLVERFPRQRGGGGNPTKPQQTGDRRCRQTALTPQEATTVFCAAGEKNKKTCENNGGASIHHGGRASEM